MIKEDGKFRVKLKEFGNAAMGSEFQGVVGAKYYVAPEMILN